MTVHNRRRRKDDERRENENLADGRSFEERVFSRFDTLDARLGNIEARFDKVESELIDVKLCVLKSLSMKPNVERWKPNLYGKKPWLKLSRLKSDWSVEFKLDHLTHDILQARANMTRVERRVDKLESLPST